MASTTPSASPKTLRKRSASGVVGFSVNYETLTPEFVRAAKARKFRVSAYTVLDLDTMLHLVEMGVDAVETDYPGALTQLLPKESPLSP